MFYLERQNRGTDTGGTPKKIHKTRRRGILFQGRTRKMLRGTTTKDIRIPREGKRRHPKKGWTQKRWWARYERKTAERSNQLHFRRLRRRWSHYVRKNEKRTSNSERQCRNSMSQAAHATHHVSRRRFPSNRPPTWRPNGDISRDQGLRGQENPGGPR